MSSQPKELLERIADPNVLKPDRETMTNAQFRHFSNYPQYTNRKLQ